jgi:hypothetical protein
LLQNLKALYNNFIIKIKLFILKKMPHATYRDGRLLVPYIFCEGKQILKGDFLLETNQKPFQMHVYELIELNSQLPFISKKTMGFTCNICGKQTIALISVIQEREISSCSHCHSTLRFRSLIQTLSLGLFNKNYTLTQMPKNKIISGIGMSDCDSYAKLLGNIFSYTNTYYHQHPKLDICNIDDKEIGLYDFIISSEIFEHIPYFQLQQAFDNLYKLLKPGGILVFSVPYKPTGQTNEHYPELYNFKVIKEKSGYKLINKTNSAEVQIFDNLVFHDGPGTTLEMRLFSKQDVFDRLIKAGFDTIEEHSYNYKEYGILWQYTNSVPILARKTEAINDITN